MSEGRVVKGKRVSIGLQMLELDGRVRREGSEKDQKAEKTSRRHKVGGNQTAQTIFQETHFYVFVTVESCRLLCKVGISRKQIKEREHESRKWRNAFGKRGVRRNHLGSPGLGLNNIRENGFDITTGRIWNREGLRRL